jgi:hypothetical protein
MRILGVVFAVLLAAAVARADTLYAVSGSGGTASTLYTFDSTTGALTSTIGATGFSHMTGLDFDPTSGMLYGLVSSSTGATLVTINTTTGVATAVGSGVGNTGKNGGFPDMGFDSTGRLFAWGENGGQGSLGDDLYEIDKTTGVATRVGESFVGTAVVGLAELGGTLYMKNFDGSIYTMNKTTGLATDTGVNTVPFDTVRGNSLAFDSAGVGYVGGRPGGGAGFVLYDVDVGTGAFSLIGGDSVNSISAIAFSTVPEPGFMALLGVGLVALVWRRRRA